MAKWPFSCLKEINVWFYHFVFTILFLSMCGSYFCVSKVSIQVAERAAACGVPPLLDEAPRDSGTERLKCGKMMRNSREMDTAAVTLSAPWYVADGRGTKTLSAQSVM